MQHKKMLSNTADTQNCNLLRKRFSAKKARKIRWSLESKPQPTIPPAPSWMLNGETMTLCSQMIFNLASAFGVAAASKFSADALLIVPMRRGVVLAMERKMEEDSRVRADSEDDECSTPLLRAHLQSNDVSKENGPVKSDRTDTDVMSDIVVRFPNEPKKALVAMGLLLVATLLNELVLAYIHEKVPETAPLPDIFFTITPYVPWALKASEYVMLTSFGGMVILGLLHRHRWILLRRVCFIGAILYFGRAITMLVTQVPVADAKSYCSPKLKAGEMNASLLIARALRLVGSAGLNVSSKQTLCGDYIYSGHTIVLVISYLFIKEYSPRRWWLLHWFACLLSISGVTLLLLSRGHYTVDVLIAYWISTRVFWLYHTCAAYPILKESNPSNMLTNIYWFSIFRYMEGNVNSAVPRKFSWPLPWFKYSVHNTTKINIQ